ncbi:secreted RxLR effector protein 161-like [Pistacia vera]|uniref:secreted RxLR effector protein 161-like n=1 Tax=Pistacia vera TaxID=55513 RepID=UPI0012636234|nr:secreted RxLR effector protein 161-like [Pistacia vera]
MSRSKTVSMPLANHFTFSKAQCPNIDAESIRMETIPYANVIRSLMYAMISTRPDLSFVISLLSRFMSNSGMEHWTALKWVLKYVSGSLNVGLEYYKRSASLELDGFVDSDFAGDRDTRKSTTAYYFTLGGNCISWKSQLQPIVALSTTEAEYVAVADVFKEAIWLKGILSEAKLIELRPTIFLDSQSAIHLSKNPVYHERTKHIDVHYHFVRDLITKGEIILNKVPTEHNPADMGTKIVTIAKFKHCLNLLSIQ